MPWCHEYAQEIGAILVGEANFSEHVGLVTVLDGDSGKVRFVLPCEGAVTSIVFLSEICPSVSGERSGRIIVWDLQSRARRLTLQMQSGVNSMACDRAT